MRAARDVWIKEAKECRRKDREQVSFLAGNGREGHVVDFHALRMTFITNLTRFGRFAQDGPDARPALGHQSDDGRVHEARRLGSGGGCGGFARDPTVALQRIREVRATGTDGEQATPARQKRCPQWCREVPKMVPFSPHRERYGLRPNCTERGTNRTRPRSEETQKTRENTELFAPRPHPTASSCIKVPKEGLEPSRPCGHWILSPARLPIPPLRHRMRVATTCRTTR